jgi:hypothetical protein
VRSSFANTLFPPQRYGKNPKLGRGVHPGRQELFEGQRRGSPDVSPAMVQLLAPERQPGGAYMNPQQFLTGGRSGGAGSGGGRGGSGGTQYQELPRAGAPPGSPPRQRQTPHGAVAAPSYAAFLGGAKDAANAALPRIRAVQSGGAAAQQEGHHAQGRGQQRQRRAKSVEEQEEVLLERRMRAQIRAEKELEAGARNPDAKQRNGTASPGLAARNHAATRRQARARLLAEQAATETRMKKREAATYGPMRHTDYLLKHHPATALVSLRTR